MTMLHCERPLPTFSNEKLPSTTRRPVLVSELTICFTRKRSNFYLAAFYLKIVGKSHRNVQVARNIAHSPKQDMNHRYWWRFPPLLCRNATPCCSDFLHLVCYASLSPDVAFEQGRAALALCSPLAGAITGTCQVGSSDT